MSLADELRARMRLIPVHWEQHKLYARALILAEAVEKLPEPAVTVHSYLDGVACSHHYADPRLATTVEKLKEMVR